MKRKQDAKITVEQRLLGKHKPHVPKTAQIQQGHKGEQRHYSKW